MWGEKQKADTSSQNYPFAWWNAVLSTQSKNFPTKVKTFGSMLDQEKVRFSSESFSAHLVPIYTWQSVLTTLSKSLSQNADVFLPNVWKLKEFLSRRRQFWQPHQQFFEKKPRTFRSRSEQKKVIEAFFRSILAAIFSLRHVKTSSEKPDKNVLTGCGNFSINVGRWRKNSK